MNLRSLVGVAVAVVAVVVVCAGGIGVLFTAGGGGLACAAPIGSASPGGTVSAQTMALTDAAQSAQTNALPDAYAKWQPAATMPASAVGSGIWRTIPGDREQCLANCPGLVNSDEQSSPARGCLPDVAVLARAATWLTAWDGGPVPYLSSADHTTWFGGYRRDCSGYVSMALGLPGPGLDTAGLAARSTAIPKAALRAGDLLINPAPNLAGHVVIFDRWTDATMSSYVGYEQSGDGGTHHRVIPYPYFGGYLMSPFRL